MENKKQFQKLKYFACLGAVCSALMTAGSGCCCFSSEYRENNECCVCESLKETGKFLVSVGKTVIGVKSIFSSDKKSNPVLRFLLNRCNDR